LSSLIKSWKFKEQDKFNAFSELRRKFGRDTTVLVYNMRRFSSAR